MNIPKVTVYGLGTFITLLISKGIDVVTVADLAGHSMVPGTLDFQAITKEARA